MLRKTFGIAAGLTAILGLATQASADEITITADQWCPYNCEPGSDAPGYVVELAKRIYESEGHTIKYVNNPWQRALKMGARGKVNGVIAVSFQPETEQMVLPEEPLTSYEIKAVTDADDGWSYDGIESIGERTVAVVAGYNYGDRFMEWQRSNEGQQVVNQGDGALQRNLKMVASGRADFAIDGANVLGYNIDQMGMKESFRFAGTIGEAVPLYLGFSMKAGNAEEYARLWTEGVRRMRESGELQEVLDKYGVSDWAE
ncbi:substrate-binding periplasmic protein [Ferruginivarius sediminum]|uniref:substrate-binding periplasmic protein n=1 Tax=Ferruginivarius sediminum TaxID=2661937 RepID=UPI00137AB1A2|nr:transporter substrate-binding domain-containing protein [Ferruginivarius sediminum]